MRDDIAPHVQDITRALGGKVSEQEIEKELSNYINVYRVSLDTAKRSIVKKHGGNPAHLSPGTAKTSRRRVPAGGISQVILELDGAMRAQGISFRRLGVSDPKAAHGGEQTLGDLG